MKMESNYPSEMLFAETQRIAYPEGVVRVPKLIPGLAFFPGGRGVFQERRELPEFAFRKVMIVGQVSSELAARARVWAAEARTAAQAG